MTAFFAVAVFFSGCVACASREAPHDEPVQSPAHPDSPASPWQRHVLVLAGDPPLPGDPANSQWPGLTSDQDVQKKGQKTIYACPMHPDVQSTQPGECPRCHMALEAQP